uniref:Uncharacterized protein n=1 Tax=Aegilops tauschii subsp. strangulata TaxID=200361 RepID=A0A453SB04_AEGTS
MGVFAVTKVSEGPVRPSAATPSETLPLAWVDRYPTHRGLVESVHVYRDAVPETVDAGAEEKKRKPPAAVVRGALADALVHYYPFAGRIVEGEDTRRPAVLCSAEGVYFVEATANCTLADVSFLERPLLLGKDQLVPYPTPELWAVEPQNSLAMIQGHGVYLRRLRDRPAHQPRGGRRHGRGPVPERHRRPCPRPPGAPRQAGLGARPLPRPGHQARPAPGAAGAGPRVHRVRLPGRLPRQDQVAVLRVHRRQALLRLRHRHRQALAVPDAGHRPGRSPRRGRQALLLRQRPPRAKAGAGILGQRHLPGEGVGAGGEGRRLVGGRDCRGGPRSEATHGGGVSELGRVPHRRPRPVPDDVRLRVGVRVGLE